MRNSFNFEEFREIEQKIRKISKKINSLEKERDELKHKKSLESFFNEE